jgi:DNA repair protein RecO (recombination protein O)
MHHKYHTQGIILSSKNLGEANKLIFVYTREMGLIKAIAQGVRLGKSKLRFSLQDFSLSNIDFVKGRDLWRITSASFVSSFSIARESKDSMVFISHICSLIERLCGEEEKNEKVFDDFINSLKLLNNQNIESSFREALELYVVLRILNNLGYIGDSEIINKYIKNSFNKDSINFLLKDRKLIIFHINKALKESHL